VSAHARIAMFALVMGTVVAVEFDVALFAFGVRDS
jgi:hypothetical protein